MGSTTRQYGLVVVDLVVVDFVVVDFVVVDFVVVDFAVVDLVVVVLLFHEMSVILVGVPLLRSIQRDDHGSQEINKQTHIFFWLNIHKTAKL